MSDDTRLSDLLSLNLHNFEDEVWMIAQHIAHMGQILQDGENVCFMSNFF